MKTFNFFADTVIIFGTYGRRDVASASLRSLIDSTRGCNVKIIVSDATPTEEFDDRLAKLLPDQYIWTPGNVNMATSRNIGVSLARDKYVFDWIMFVEDDLFYQSGWYPSLLETASKLYGRKSPLGLAYGVFSAVSNAVKDDESVLYDAENDVFASMFGLRADQRLYKASHYFNVVQRWDSDLLGISSCQTGKPSHRDLMRGYCGCGIGHRTLVAELTGQASTWAGTRDIGPAAFDKRLEGYDGLCTYVKSQYSLKQAQRSDSTAPYATQGNGSSSESSTPSIPPLTKIPMTAVIPKSQMTLRKLARRLKKAGGILFRGT